MQTFNTWVDVEKEYLKETVKNYGMVAVSVDDMMAQFNRDYEIWLDKNYNGNPTFTVKEQDSTDSSDAYDRATCHN